MAGVLRLRGSRGGALMRSFQEAAAFKEGLNEAIDDKIEFTSKTGDSTYIMEAILGEGAFGRVSAGCRQHDNLPVAMKTIKNSLVRLEDEISANAAFAAAGGHLNVLEYIDTAVCSQPDLVPGPILVMGRCTTNFAKFWQSKHAQTAPMGLVVDIMVQFWCGLSFIHDLDFVHNDISAYNVLVAVETGTLKFCDFGRTAKAVTNTAGLRGTKERDVVVSGAMWRSICTGIAEPHHKISQLHKCYDALFGEGTEEPYKVMSVLATVYDADHKEPFVGDRECEGWWDDQLKNLPSAESVVDKGLTWMFSHPCKHNLPFGPHHGVALPEAVAHAAFKSALGYREFAGLNCRTIYQEISAIHTPEMHEECVEFMAGYTVPQK